MEEGKGVKKNRKGEENFSNLKFPKWEEKASPRRHGGHGEVIRQKATADCAEDADRILCVRSACAPCARAFGREEWVFFIQLSQR